MLDRLGSLDTYNETDVYLVNLQAGSTYFIEVDGDFAGREATTLTLDDPMVHLKDSVGVEVAFNDDLSSGYTFDSRIVYQAQVAGQFTVEVEAYSASQLGTYRLVVSVDDYRGTVFGPGAVGTLTQGGVIDGSLDYAGSNGFDGDVDLFLVTLVGGLRYDVTVQGAASGHGTLQAAQLQVLDAGGTAVGSVAGETALTLRPDQSRMYYLEVKDALQGPGGSFALSVSVGLGSDGADHVVGTTSDDNVAVLDGSDTVNLGLGNDTAAGGLGADTLLGRDGDDLLAGGDDRDRLHGGKGNDTLIGGAGSDVLNGGDGDDVFRFLSIDDSAAGQRDALRSRGEVFQGAGVAGGDLIDLSGVDADVTLDGQQHLIFDGTSGRGHV